MQIFYATKFLLERLDWQYLQIRLLSHKALIYEKYLEDAGWCFLFNRSKCSLKWIETSPHQKLVNTSKDAKNNNLNE